MDVADYYRQGTWRVTRLWQAWVLVGHVVGIALLAAVTGYTAYLITTLMLTSR
jgi:hypothetical protein